MARVLAISSHVVRGHVGLAATVPGLQHFGHEVWALPTVLLASRPGLGRLAKFELPAPDLAGMLAALEADGCWPTLDAVFTGYFASAASVRTAAEGIARIKAANPRALILVDPILGDGDRLYVPTETAEAVREVLLPLATIATPNLFELQWLTGHRLQGLDEVADAARGLGPATVVVTSAAETPASVTTLLVGATQRFARLRPRRAQIPNGAGDLFAGLLFGALLAGRPVDAALDAALADLESVLAASEGRDVLQLSRLSPGR
jgi:pyridoxine kinase